MTGLARWSVSFSALGLSVIIGHGGRRQQWWVLAVGRHQNQRRAVDSPLPPLNGGKGSHCRVVFITIIIVGRGPFVASTSSAASGVIVAAGGGSRDIGRSCSHRERERPT